VHPPFAVRHCILLDRTFRTRPRSSRSDPPSSTYHFVIIVLRTSHPSLHQKVSISQSVLDRFPSFSTRFASTRRALSGRTIRFYARRRLLNQYHHHQCHLDIYHSIIYPFSPLSSLPRLSHHLSSFPSTSSWSFVSTLHHLPTSSPITFTH